MFCPPGAKLRSPRRMTPNDVKMHLQGIEKAGTSSWIADHGNETSDDDGGEVTSDTGARTYLSLPAQISPDTVTPRPSEQSALLVNVEARVAAKSLGSLQMFTAEHVYKQNVVVSPHATATSGSSEADDDESSLAESLPQDETEMDDCAELQTLLNGLLLESSSDRKRLANVLGKDYSDPTETETTLEEQEDDFFPMIPNAKVTTIYPDGGCSTSESELGDESDSDSLDLGVATTMWSAKLRSHFSSSASNRATKSAIAKTFTLPSINTSQGLDLSYELDDDEGQNDTDDEQHEGGELFMLAEGMRYVGHDNGEDSGKDDVAVVKEIELPLVDRCFGGIQLLTPRFFTTGEQATNPAAVAAPVRASAAPSPLSSIVHHMDLDLFSGKLKRSKSTKQPNSEASGEDNNGASSSPVKGVRQSMLQSDQIALDGENRRANLSSSFRSSTKSSRVAYSLASGKKSMSKVQRVYSKSYLPLPNKRISSQPKEEQSLNRPDRTSHGSLCVLLADLGSKIFEVVPCDVNRETTVGDVLSKARSMATDPALSEQKYVSFCYGNQEFGAPMLPVSVMIDWDKHKTRPLVVAVPMGSTAAEMQSVKRVLWKNPKLKEWWGQRDPFSPPTRKRSSRKTKSAAK
jgi:hypothetical protein